GGHPPEGAFARVLLDQRRQLADEVDLDGVEARVGAAEGDGALDGLVVSDDARRERDLEADRVVEALWTPRDDWRAYAAPRWHDDLDREASLRVQCPVDVDAYVYLGRDACAHSPLERGGEPVGQRREDEREFAQALWESIREWELEL